MNVLWWTPWAGGRQVGSKQHQISSWNFVTKNIFQREEYPFFALLIDGMVFFTGYWSYFPLFTSGGCCNWFNRLLKISLSKKNWPENQAFCVPLFPQIQLILLHAHSCEKASDKCTLEANHSLLSISTYKNGKIIPSQRQQVMMFFLRLKNSKNKK